MQKLNEIQQKLKAPKNQYNKFSNFYYRSCEDILEAVKPLLGTATLVLSDEIIIFGDRYYIKATATLKDDKEEVSVTAYAREAVAKKGMDEAQITGASSSYARKYALNGLFLIDDTKNIDSQDNKKENKENKEDEMKSQKVKILYFLKELGHTPKDKNETIKTIKKLTGLEGIEKNYSEIISRLKILINEKNENI